jgi:hypothetical protein
MSLNLIFQKLGDKKKGLNLILVLILFCVFTSCSVKKNRFYKEQFKIINYVFPPDIDSTLCDYLDKYHNKKNKDKWNIQFGRWASDYIDADYYVSLNIRLDNIDKKIEFKEQNNSPSIYDREKFLLYRTNRYVVVNKGQYIIPIVLDYDLNFVGFEKVEYPLSTYSKTGGALFILFKDWEIVKITGHYPEIQ